MTRLSRRTLILIAAGGSLALLAGAFLYQFLGYAPCKLCLWQRWPHAAAVAIGAIGAAAPLAVVAWAGAVAALTTAGIGAYHTGVERGWWQGPTSCTGSGEGLGGLTGADLLSVDGAGHLVLCDQISWSLFGLSMANYNVLASLALAAIWITAATRPSS